MSTATKPICEWPVEPPLVLDGLLGPEVYVGGLFKDPRSYKRPAVSEENLVAIQERINALPPSKAEQALREVNDYLNAPYPQYFQRRTRQRGWTLHRCTKRWWKNGVDYMLPGDYVLAYVREAAVQIPSNDKSTTHTVYAVRRDNNLATDYRHVIPIIF